MEKAVRKIKKDATEPPPVTKSLMILAPTVGSLYKNVKPFRIKEIPQASNE
jgi:hypothetical protein